ncbi:MAG: hypothetical protein EOO77_32130 [Oxalobacteraceae bacterium]|nr:MAG: hypothetical protein EOO77_32130 [Oxalobacteraceae bacterium]
MSSDLLGKLAFRTGRVEDDVSVLESPSDGARRQRTVVISCAEAVVNNSEVDVATLRATIVVDPLCRDILRDLNLQPEAFFLKIHAQHFNCIFDLVGLVIDNQQSKIQLHAGSLIRIWAP